MEKVFLPAIAIPAWLIPIEAENLGKRFDTPEQKLELVIRLAEKNVLEKTGGPFAAAVFSRTDHTLTALGINAVTGAGQSLAHAEMMAAAHAQNRLKLLHLNDFTLASSCEPCVMCFGGILWSGVRELCYAAPGKFAVRAGFDEGDKVENWQESLRKRGLTVRGPMLEEKARAPFDLFQKNGGVLY